MATSGTETVGQIVKDALLEIEAQTMGQAVDSDQEAHAMRVMNRMLKGWQQAHGTPFYLVASLSVPLTTSASYTLTGRPYSLISVNHKQGGIETPMLELTRREYDDLPQKDVTGQPTQFYYDRQAEDETLFVWPVSDTTDGTLEITYERETDDVTSASDVIDLPVDWYEAALYGLAARLCPTYGKPGLQGQVSGLAKAALDRALGAGVDGTTVEFRPCRS